MSSSNALAAATAALSKANRFTKSVEGKTPSQFAPKPAPVVTPKPKPAPSEGESVAAGLKAIQDNENQYKNATKMHRGGPVKADGVYRLKKGEHVLTEQEARLAQKHALMASGIKSLAKAAGSKKPTKVQES